MGSSCSGDRWAGQAQGAPKAMEGKELESSLQGLARRRGCAPCDPGRMGLPTLSSLVRVESTA